MSEAPRDPAVSESGRLLRVVPQEPPLKTRGTALLFLLLLGWAGGHRFYLRRAYSGLVYALTGGFCLLGVLVDLFRLGKLLEAENERIRADFAADPESFARMERELPEWAAEGSAWARLQLPFVLAFWLLGPPTMIFFALLFGRIDAAVIVLAILAATAFLESTRRLVERQPKALTLPLIGALLRGLRDLETFYRFQRPFPLLVYLIYPLALPFLLPFSQSARQEAKMFARPIGLILAALVTNAVVTYRFIFPPYLGPAEAALLTFLSVVLVGLLLVCFLLPTVTTAMSLNLSGRTGLARVAVAVALPLSLLTFGVTWSITREAVPLPSQLTLAERFSKPAFRADLRERSEMFLSYYAERFDEAGPALARDDALTGKYRSVLGAMLPAAEKNAFTVWGARVGGGPLLTVVCDNPGGGEAGTQRLLLVAQRGRVHASWAKLAPELQRDLGAAVAAVGSAATPEGGLRLADDDALLEEHAQGW